MHRHRFCDRSISPPQRGHDLGGSNGAESAGQALRSAANATGRGDYVHLWAGQAAALPGARPATEPFDELIAETGRLLDKPG